ncbi:MAG: D-hexose-6-phosphate mutarotase [Methylophilaceae bacterium]
MSDLVSLNERFALAGNLSFIEATDYLGNSLAIARIQNVHASADIAIQGAQILTYEPENDAPVIWLSPHAKFIAGKAIRGGVPVCWPWFGNHETETSYPAHGFARNLAWNVLGSDALEDGSTRLVFELQSNDTAKMQWPFEYHLRYVVTVGATLSVELITKNIGSSPFVISEALHTYLVIGDIEKTAVTGLADTEYLDKVDGFKRKTQSGDIKIRSEVDRVYLNTAADCVIEDSKLNRRIRISKSGSQTTVVWNPWAEKTVQMGDLGNEGYRGFVCVESANAAENALTLTPGESHTLRVTYSVEH